MRASLPLRLVRWATLAGVVIATAGVQLLDRPANNVALAWVRALAELVALGAVLVRWRRQPVERRTWLYAAVGLALLLLGDVLAGFAFLEPAWLRVPEWASMLLLHVLPVPAFVAALAAWPKPRAEPAGSSGRALLDGLLFGYAAWFLIWTLGGRGWEVHSAGSAASSSLIARFALLGVLLGACVYQGARDSTRWRGPLAWLGGSFLSLTLASGFLSASLLSGQHTSFRVVGYLAKAVAVWLIAMAAWSDRPLTGEPHRHAESLREALPYAPAVAATFAGLLLGLMDVPVDSQVIGFGAPLVALLLGRQFAAFAELKRLSVELESRVVERTRALETAQAVVMRTERVNTLALMGAGLAHDVNNHLTTIQLTTELIAGQLRAGAPPEVADCEAVLAAAEHAGRLTQRLLRIGRDERAPGRLDLRLELDASLELLRVLLPRRIRLELALEDGSFPVAMAPDQVQQILINLVSNARDAIEGDGRIAIALKRSTDAGEPQALVTVQDDGSGMTSEVQRRLFEPFFSTKGDRGTGLGLSSVQALMERHGGRIELTSHPGAGTTFTLKFPLMAPTSPPAT